MLLTYFGPPSDGSLRTRYTWDAENRLIGYEPLVPTAGSKRAEDGYDSVGRRTEKRVYDWNAGATPPAWSTTPSESKRFVWSGWLMLLELDQSTTSATTQAVRRKQTWGLDLAGQSGASQGRGPGGLSAAIESAGGIGGLVAVDDDNGTTTGGSPTADDMRYVYAYDANGNVGQLVDWAASSASASLKAKYEYDVYGNLTARTGSYEAVNQFRFSTKYWDDETGLGYWGYRYYDPSIGRWVSRDLREYTLDTSLYSFEHSSPTTYIDATGQKSKQPRKTNAENAGTKSKKDDKDFHARNGIYYHYTLECCVNGNRETKEVSGWTLHPSDVTTALAASKGTCCVKYLYVSAHHGIGQTFADAHVERVPDETIADSVRLCSHATVVLKMCRTYDLAHQIADRNQDVSDVTIEYNQGECDELPIGVGVEGIDVSDCWIAGGKICKIAIRPDPPPAPPRPKVGPFCFPAGTRVLCADRERNIEDLAEGEVVVAFEPCTSEACLTTVSHIARSASAVLYRVELRDNAIVVQCTADHPFLVGASWVRAMDLRRGDHVQTVDGCFVDVENVCREVLSEPVEVWNVTVGSPHTFVVSPNRVVVHNKGP